MKNLFKCLISKETILCKLLFLGTIELLLAIYIGVISPQYYATPELFEKVWYNEAINISAIAILVIAIIVLLAWLVKSGFNFKRK